MSSKAINRREVCLCSDSSSHPAQHHPAVFADSTMNHPQHSHLPATGHHPQVPAPMHPAKHLNQSLWAPCFTHCIPVHADLAHQKTHLWETELDDKLTKLNLEKTEYKTSVYFEALYKKSHTQAVHGPRTQVAMPGMACDKYPECCLFSSQQQCK